MTHKGTLVAGAMAPRSLYRRVGIDLEVAGPKLERVAATVAPEGPPPFLGREQGLLVAFSLKEALYKAAPRRIQEKVGFADLRLTWHDRGDRMEASCDALPGIDGFAMLIGDWVAAAAGQRVENPNIDPSGDSCTNP